MGLLLAESKRKSQALSLSPSRDVFRRSRSSFKFGLNDQENLSCQILVVPGISEY
jgi:hypothetical protein